MADYESITEKIGNLTAICPECESIMNQLVSLQRFDAIRDKLDVAFRLASRRVSESNHLSLNSDLGREMHP
jgi:hypothetical protein